MAGLKLIKPTDEDVEQPPRYTEDRYYRNGEVFFRYNPPREPREEGIVESCVLGVGEPERMKAYKEAERLNRLIDEWRIEKDYGKDALTLYRLSFPEKLKTGELWELIEVYLSSAWTRYLLSEEAMQNYTWMLETAIHEPHNGYKLGSYHIEELGRSDAEAFHRQVAEERGVHTANHMLSCLRKAYNQAIEWGLTRNNPFARFTLIEPKKQGKPRAAQWTDEDREKLMTTAAQDDRWKDAYKVLCLMRDGMTLRQAISEEGVTKPDGKPYDITHMSKILARLRDAAGLPSTLKVGSAFKRR